MVRMIAVAAAAALIAPPAARADTIVFQRKGDIWAVQPDGGGQRQVTRGGGYAWPSAADDGTIAALAGDGRIHRFAPSGAEVGAPTPPQAAFASDDLPAEPPTHVRVSPDGRKVAYDEVIGGEVTTLWTPAGDTTLDFPNQATGQEGFEAPSWIGSDRLLLSLDPLLAGPDVATLSLYDTASGDESAADLVSDRGSPWATGFAAAAARAGTRVAALEDDAADGDGTPTRVAVRLFTFDAPGGPATFRCELSLPATDSSGASPSFSADGTRLAWAQRDGIHVASLGDLGNCGAIKQRTIGSPGDTQPYWTPAAAPAGAGGGPSGGGGP